MSAIFHAGISGARGRMGQALLRLAAVDPGVVVVGAVARTLNQLQKVFLLRNCTDSMFEGRTRACLFSDSIEQLRGTAQPRAQAPSSGINSHRIR